MADARIHDLATAIPLVDGDLLDVEQVDQIDRKCSLLTLRTWLATKMSPTLSVGPYYVDAVSGSDAADGLSAGTAKQTIKAACDAVPVGGVATINLLTPGTTQPYPISADITVTGKVITLNGPGPSSHAQINPAAYSSGGVECVRGFNLDSSALRFSWVDVVSPLKATPANPLGTDMQASIFRRTSFNNIIELAFSFCTLSLADFPVAQSVQLSTLSIALNGVTLLQNTTNTAAPLLALISTSTCVLSAAGVTLPGGRTWKSLISGLSYGGDLGPCNLLHNRGNVFDSNQS
jgi:hypothetical protein